MSGLLIGVAIFAVLGVSVYTSDRWVPVVFPEDSGEVLPNSATGRAGSIDLERTAKLIHERVNIERARAGVVALVWNDDLARVALAHSQDMAERGYYDHVSPDGKDHRDRYADAGLTCFVRFDNGAIDNGSENLVSGSGVGSENQEAELAVSSWMGSTAGHRENLLRSQWVSEGIGIAVANDVIYVTQNFCN